MNAAKNEFVADTLLNVLATEPGLSLYLGLLLSGPGPNGVLEDCTEVSDPEYGRQLVSLQQVGRLFVANANELRFPKASRQWGFVTHIGVYDAPTGGNCILLKSIGSILPIDERERVLIKPGHLHLYTGSNSMLL